MHGRRIACHPPFHGPPGHARGTGPRRTGAGAGGARPVSAHRAQHTRAAGAQCGRHGPGPGAFARRRRQHQPRAGERHHARLPALLRGHHAAQRGNGRAAQLWGPGERGLQRGGQVRQRNRRRGQRVRPQGRGFHPHHHLGEERTRPAPARHAAGAHRPGICRGSQRRALHRRHPGGWQALHGRLPASQRCQRQGGGATVHRQRHQHLRCHAAEAGRANALLRARRRVPGQPRSRAGAGALCVPPHGARQKGA